MSAHAVRTERLRTGLGALSLPQLAPDVWTTLAVGAGLAAVAFGAGGGLALGRTTTVEIVLTLLAGVAGAAAILLGARRASAGGWPLGCFAALAVWTAVSVSWSVAPDASWQEASRTLAYLGVFALGLSLVRLAPGRWAGVLGGVVLGAALVCGWALLTKVEPGHLSANEIYARLRAPYGYWNAIGLTSALGAIGCLWLGTRRHGHAALSALAYPALGLMLVTLLLAYSRGSLLVLLLGLALWFWLTPERRLRGIALLACSGLAAGVVVVWAFSQDALTKDRIALDERVAAGHGLGILLVAMLLTLGVAGLAVGFWAERRPLPPSARGRIAAVVLTLLALVPVALVGALATSHRGLVGTISHGVHSLTDPNARVPNDPSRLTAIGSVRARYWKEALKVYSAHPVAGVGAGGYGTARLRYRTDTLDVQHAHGYLVQTLADLGIVGLLLSLALAAAWLGTAVRAARPGNLVRVGRRRLRRRPLDLGPERAGLVAMLCLVVVFALHSLVDWTWFVPGNACVALLCAGWLAGRGSILEPSEGLVRRRVGTPLTLGLRRAAAGALLALALLLAWTEWQPLRAVNTANTALASLGQPQLALARARSATGEDPLSVNVLSDLSAVQQAAGQSAAARATLVRAVRLQPSNPSTWLGLAQFDVAQSHPRSALAELRPALFLDPQSAIVQSTFIAAYRAAHPHELVSAAGAPGAAAATATPNPAG